MSADKRTPVQMEFDLAAHGWAFCNQDMLLGKIERLTEIAKRLPAHDPRFERLEVIKTYLTRKRDHK